MTIKRDGSGDGVQAGKPYTNQSVAIGAGSVACTAFSTNAQNRVGISVAPNQTTHIRVVATVNCWISFGNPPTAALARDPASMYLPAGLPEYFWVSPGSQIAVIQDSAGGSLYISELAND
jgi:hypothetical protein